MNVHCFSKRYACFTLFYKIFVLLRNLGNPCEIDGHSDAKDVAEGTCSDQETLPEAAAKAASATGDWVTKWGLQLILLQKDYSWTVPKSCCFETFQNKYINLPGWSHKVEHSFICINHENLGGTRSIIRALSIRKVNQHGREEKT